MIKYRFRFFGKFFKGHMWPDSKGMHNYLPKSQEFIWK